MISNKLKSAIDEVEKIAKEEKAKVGIAVVEVEDENEFCDTSYHIVHKGTIARSDALLNGSGIVFYSHDKAQRVISAEHLENILDKGYAYWKGVGIIEGQLSSKRIIETIAANMFLANKDEDANKYREIAGELVDGSKEVVEENKQAKRDYDFALEERK